MKIVTTSLKGFGGMTVIPKGTVELLLTLGTYPTSVVILMSFLIVKTPMEYNAIYNRPLLNTISAIPSTYYKFIKCTINQGIEYANGDWQALRKYYVDSIQEKSSSSVMMLDVEPPKR